MAAVHSYTYVYDSSAVDGGEDETDVVHEVLDRLERIERDERDERGEQGDRHLVTVEYLDVAAADDSVDGQREAMLTVKNATRIGTPPAAIFDENGDPDFSAGVLITEAETGRREVYTGPEALAALDGDDSGDGSGSTHRQ